MQKKIKDLTREETNAICKKYKLCIGCPLQLEVKDFFALCLPEIIPIKDKLDKKMEEKIETEEDKKEEEETKFVTKIEYEKNKEKALFNACVELQRELIGYEESRPSRWL